MLGKIIAIFAWSSLLSISSYALTPSDFSRFTLLTSFGLFLILLSGFGQAQVILFLNGAFGSKDRSHSHFFNIKNSLNAICYFGIFASCVGAIFVHQYFQLNNIFLIIIFICWVFSSAIQTFLAEECKTVFRFWTSSLLGTSGGIGGAVGTLVAIGLIFLFSKVFAVKIDLLIAMVSLFIGSFSAVLALVFLLMSDFKKINRTLFSDINKIRLSKKIIYMGGASTASALLIFILGQSDLWVVSLYFGDTSVGDYGVATYLARFVSMIGILFSSSVANKIASMIASEQKVKIIDYVGKLNLISCISGFFIFLLIAVLWKLGVVSHFFKIDPSNFFAIFSIVSLGHLIGSYKGLGPVVLVASGNFSTNLYLTLFATLVAVLGALVLVKFFGVLGVSIGYSVGYVIYTYACSFFAKKLIGIP